MGLSLNVVSLFSGCLGLDLGLEAAGFEPILYCENDADCQRVIRERRPSVPLLADVREFDERTVDGAVDLLAGGFPCQDLSYAGRGAGLDGDRSGLWHEMARSIRLLRPRLVIVENVPGLATRGLGRVLYDLAEARYVGSFLRLRASDVGAPHGRERIFILATDADRERLEGRSTDGERRGERSARTSRVEASADAGRERFQSRPDDGGLPRTEGSRAREGVQRQRRRNAAGDGDEAPLGGSRSGRLEGGAPADADGRRRQGVRIEEPSRLKGACRSLVDRRDRIRQLDDAETTDWGAYGAAVRRWQAILDRAVPRPADDRGRLEPRFVEWMLGFPDGWTDVGLKRNARLKMLGNSVQVQCAEVVGRALREEIG